MRSAAAALALLAALCFTSCGRAQRHTRTPPPPEVAKRAVESLLPGLQFGPTAELETFREVRSVDVAGAHFEPGENHWRIHHCAEYTNLASDAPQRRCDRNVIVYQLDTKKWVGLATGAGTLFRWQVIDDGTKRGNDASGNAQARPEDSAQPARAAP
jgi:hypothetical protein